MLVLTAMDTFAEGKHPRDDHGRFGSGSSGSAEKRDDKLTAQIIKLRDHNWPGVSSRPSTFGASAATAAKAAFKNNVDYYVVPTGLGAKYGTGSELQASYLLGQGLRITPSGEVFSARK